MCWKASCNRSACISWAQKSRSATQRAAALPEMEPAAVLAERMLRHAMAPHVVPTGWPKCRFTLAGLVACVSEVLLACAPPATSSYSSAAATSWLSQLRSRVLDEVRRTCVVDDGVVSNATSADLNTEQLRSVLRSFHFEIVFVAWVYIDSGIYARIMEARPTPPQSHHAHGSGQAIQQALEGKQPHAPPPLEFPPDLPLCPPAHVAQAAQASRTSRSVRSVARDVRHRQKIKALTKRLSRALSRVHVLKCRLKEARRELAAARVPLAANPHRMRGQTRTKMSHYGMYKLAYMRNCGHGSAATIALHLGTEASRQTVCKHEQLLAANLRCQCLLFHKTLRDYVGALHDYLLHMPSTCIRAVTWEMHTICADATNTYAAQQQKGHVCRIETSFNCALHPERWDGEELTDADAPAVQAMEAAWASLFDLEPTETQFRAFGEVERVPSHCDGHTVRAMLLKQMSSVGCPLWNAPDPDSDGLHEPPRIPHLHLATFVFGTDQGPDQVFCDKLIRAELVHKPLTLLFRQWCNEHAAHLMVKRQLTRLGAAHWADIAKVTSYILCVSHCCFIDSLMSVRL